MQVLDLLNSGSRILKDNKIISHKLDTEIILAKILNKSREEIIINLDKYISNNEINKFDKLIKRRSKSEPIAYILNEKEFWSKIFYVNSSVLIPRPETELLIDRILHFYKKKNNNINILDIGTGSGCMLLSILSEIKNSRGIGVDISSKAIRIALKNSFKNKLDHKSKFYCRSLDEINDCKFDLIVSNPPYISKNELRNLDKGIKKFEPKLALDGGNDGLDLIKKVIYKSRRILKNNGMLALEIGNGHCKKVSKILCKNKFRIEYLVKDYKDNVRGILSIKMLK